MQPTFRGLPTSPSQLTGSSLSGGRSASNTNPHSTPNLERIEEFISKIDHIRDQLNRQTTTGDSKAGASPPSGAQQLEVVLQKFSGLLNQELGKAIAGSRRGDLGAIQCLVTIAGAQSLVADHATRARTAIDSISRPNPQPNGDVIDPTVPTSIQAAITAFSALHRTVLDHQPTADWLAQSTGSDLGGRAVRVSDVPPASRGSEHPASSVKREAEDMFRGLSGKSLPPLSREGFDEHVLIPGMKTLERRGLTVWTVAGQGGIESFPAKTPADDYDLRETDMAVVAQQMLEAVIEDPSSPRVTLYFRDQHWIALIAMPPEADEEGARPSLIIFDSNASAEGGHSSKVVGINLAKELRDAGHQVHTAFGSIQDGMAANACGPLCFSAIDFAFRPSAGGQGSLSADQVTSRLKGFIGAFATVDQSTRNNVLGTVQAKLLPPAVSAAVPAPASVPPLSAKAAASEPALASVAASKSSLLTPEELRRIKSELKAELAVLAKLKSQVDHGLQEASAYERGTGLTKRNPERANAYTEAAKALHPLISQSQSRIDELVAKHTALEAYLGKVSEFAKLKEQWTAALTEQARLASKPEGSNYNIHAAVRSGQLSGKVGELTARMEDLKREGEQHANLVYDLYTTPPVSNSEPAPG
jgi:hypothetical protein